MRSGHGRPQGFRSYISASAVIAWPAVVSLGVLPSGDWNGHIVNYRCGACAHFQCRCVHRDRFDRRSYRHFHVRGPIQCFSRGNLRPRSNNSFQFPGPVIKHRAGRLGLNNLRVGAVSVFAAEHLVGRIPKRRILRPVLQRALHSLLNFRIQRQHNMISAGPQPVFHGRTVGSIVFQSVQLQQDADHFLHRVFHIMGIGIHAVSAAGRFPQHCRRLRIKRCLILFIGDILVFIHTAEYVIGTVIRNRRVILVPVLPGVIVPPGIVIVRIIGRARQHGAFPQRQFPEILAKVSFRRHLDPVIVFSQINRIQIAFQDLILCIAGFKLNAQIRFLDFPLVALF